MSTEPSGLKLIKRNGFSRIEIKKSIILSALAEIRLKPLGFYFS
jgi:hypothetical protein